MQTIIFNDQESDQSQPALSANHPMGTLVFGLLLAFIFMLFDRQHQPQLLATPPERTRGWGRTLWVWVLIGLALFVLINLITGP